jgi:hypothetical protein
MRLERFLLILSCAAGLADAIRLPSVIQNVLGIGRPKTSAIPQFILDTEHPWLKDNKRWLSRYPGVRNAICDKSSPLWQNPATDAHILPQDLFHELGINNNKAGISRLGWKNLAERSQEMNNCPAALQDVRHLRLDIYAHDSKWSDYAEDSIPPPEVPQLFAEVLSSMTGLERLDFGVSGKASASFERAFTKANITLPSVTDILPGAYSDWLLPRCPNAEVVVAGGYFDHWSWAEYEPELNAIKDKHEALIDATRGLPLRKLDMKWGWSTELLERLLDASPNLTILNMDGPLNRYNRMKVSEAEALKRYLSILAQFSHLEELRLPAAHELDLGYEGGAGCGNAYFGESGRAYGRMVAQEDAETIEAAAAIVHDALPQLKSFTIGSQSPNITLNDAGRMEMSWPWTGRMEEYTYEVWPK